MLGYPKNLYILPFDHRASFIESFLGHKKRLNPKETKLISSYKSLIFEGFFSVAKKIKFSNAELAILVDEEFGLPILKSAQKKKITFLLPVEKSGQRIFDFAHGRQFSKSIRLLKPNIVKALVRFNPAFGAKNKIQLDRLATLSTWCQKNNYKLLIELLVPPASSDLKKVKNKKEAFDHLLRPTLTVRVVKDFHAAGIEPDVWKIEAMERKADWQKVIKTIRAGEKRQNVSIVMLGRGESFAKVKSWMDNCPKNEINGFAIGRTVFLRPLLDLHAGLITKKQAMKEVAKNYSELINYWQNP